MPRASSPTVGGWALALALFLWFGITMGWIGLLTVEKAVTDTLGPAACPITPGGSDHGEASWSWFPPGRVCTFPEASGVPTRRPPPHRILVGGGLLLWGGSLVALTAQHLRRRDDRWGDPWVEDSVAPTTSSPPAP